MRRSCFVAVTAVVLGVIAPLRGFAQSPALSSDALESVVVSSSIASASNATVNFEQRGLTSRGSGPAVGVGVKVGTLGIGVQGAVQVVNRVNVRGGFNVLNYDHTFTESSTSYDATLRLRSVEASLDLFLLGGFRFSPGVLLYNNNHVDAGLSVPPGQTFSVGGVTYVNDTPPLGGSGSITFNRVTPMLAIGFGNLVPRGRHFNVSLDLGVVFQDAPAVALTFSGNVCATSNGVRIPSACRPIVSQPDIVNNIASEQKKVSDALDILRYYPVASFGFGWRF